MHALRLALALASAAPATAGAQDYSVAVYRFDIHAVAGGLAEYRDTHDLAAAWGAFDASHEGVQDRIVGQALEPLVALYEAHPAWGADFALPGALVDVVADRHPGLRARMQALDGQVHFGGFTHGGDLWTAQPAAVIRRSMAATDAAFARAGLTPSPTVAPVAGQFGPGLGDLLPAGSIVVFARPAWERLHDGADPFYALGGAIAAPARSTPAVTWVFDGDAALLASGGVAVTRGPEFVTDDDALAAHEAALAAEADAGRPPTPLAIVLERLGDDGSEPLPATLDAVGLEDPRRWTGGAGIAGDEEADGGVRRRFARAFRRVHAAEILADDPDAPDVTAAWQRLLRAGIASATGPDPLGAAVRFARDAADDAEAAVAERLAGAAEVCSEFLWVRGAGGTVSCSAGPGANRRAPEEPVDGVRGTAAGEVGLVLDVEQLVDPDLPGDPLVLRLEHRFGEDLADGGPLHPRALHVPFDADGIRFVPAGRTASDPAPFVEVPAEQVADGTPLPLAGGVLDVGSLGFLVVDPALAPPHVVLYPGDGVVLLSDDTPGIGGPEVWEAYLVEDEPDALRLARRLVHAPDLYVAGPPLPEPEVPTACACAATDAGGASPLLLLVLLSARRSGRGRGRP